MRPLRPRRAAIFVAVALVAFARPVSLSAFPGAAARSGPLEAPALRLAVFDFAGDGEFARDVAAALAREPGFAVLDRSLVVAAAAGSGYSGSLNMTPQEARSLGMAVGADAIVLGYASLVDRVEPAPTRGDCFVGLFLVDGRTGALLRYRGVAELGPTLADAAARARGAIGGEVAQWPRLVRDSALRRTAFAAARTAAESDVLDFAAGASVADAEPPRFLRKPAPAMTPDAERAFAVATVDVIATFNVDGTIGDVEVVRWAGFGLDEATVAALRSARFRPATRGGKAVRSRALLRYNFRVKTGGA